MDFLISAVEIGETLQQCQTQPLGTTILSATKAMIDAVGTNTYLGTILLLAPLSKLGEEFEEWPCRVAELLASTNAADAENLFEAIRHANPGGLGKSRKFDLADSPPENLMDAMREAECRDSIAKEYCHGFAELLTFVVPQLAANLHATESVEESILKTQLEIMARIPDTLIARKCGLSVAQESAVRAEKTLAEGMAGPGNLIAASSEFDFWLRSDGHRRNPGTTADLIAAGLFCLLRCDRWHPAVYS